jgi:hypothetical protein
MIDTNGQVPMSLTHLSLQNVNGRVNGRAMLSWYCRRDGITDTSDAKAEG